MKGLGPHSILSERSTDSNKHQIQFVNLFLDTKTRNTVEGILTNSILYCFVYLKKIRK